mgnify:CR=1 FL=1
MDRQKEKTVSPDKRLIFALDVPGLGKALALIGLLANVVGYFKIGLELFAGGDASEVIKTLRERGLSRRLPETPPKRGQASSPFTQLADHRSSRLQSREHAQAIRKPVSSRSRCSLRTT